MALCSMAEAPISKELKKKCKSECKQLKKDGWTVSAMELEEAMMIFYEKLEAGMDSLRAVSRTGRASNANLALVKARSGAASMYAGSLSTKLGSLVTSMIENANGKSTTDFKAVSSSSSQQVLYNFAPQVTMMRTLKDGTYEVMLLYLAPLSLDDAE